MLLRGINAFLSQSFNCIFSKYLEFITTNSEEQTQKHIAAKINILNTNLWMRMYFSAFLSKAT